MQELSLVFSPHVTQGNIASFKNGWAQPFPKQALVFTCQEYKSFENTVGKAEIARKPAISPFPTVFSTLLENLLPSSSKLRLLSANSFSLEKSKICCLGKG